jgi:prepilin peptidase CpaA
MDFLGYSAMVWLGDFLAAAIVVLLIVVALSDIAYRTIPNRISAAIAILGMAVRLANGTSAMLISGAIALALFVFMVFLHSRGLFGGGVVKLAAAVCFGLSPAAINRFVFVAAMAGGVLAMLHLVGRRLVRNRRTRPPLPRGSPLLRRIGSVEIWRLARHGSLPYGVALACGGVWTILVGYGN